MADDSAESANTIGRVALNIPVPGLFDYRLRDGQHIGDIGRRVIVPFGNKNAVGILVEVTQQSPIPVSRLKAMLMVDRTVNALPADVLGLCRFCADYYHHPLGPIVQLALPTALRRVKTVSAPMDVYFRLNKTNKKNGLPISNRATLQRRLHECLNSQDWVSKTELIAMGSNARHVLAHWENEGWLERREQLSLAPLIAEPAQAPKLNAEQRNIIENATGSSFQVNLIYGITGSGKTEVYLRLIERVLTGNQQVLVLVPEINLTPQLTSRFASRFAGVGISLLHSGLAEGERLAHWLAAGNGTSRIVLGTRLAVFTPMPQLGLIIVDEEHDASFSQQEGLRYSARDLAVYRAQQRNIPIMLGSATPSLESWHNARLGRYGLHRLTRRAVAGANLPKIEMVDTRIHTAVEGLALLTRHAIGQTLAGGGQALVFINRRGYAPALFCADCGWSAPCHRCSARLVLHLRTKRLKCHHCGHEERIPDSCPSCGNTELRPSGHGTQRIEDTLAQDFPDARILRIDRDAIQRKGSWERMQQEIHEGRANLLVGTQLLAKGHDFPGLNTVAVVNADAALFAQDFRASERLFAQLLQVSGRAGRAGDTGHVLIQTRFPDHPLYQHLLRHDYEGFAEILLKEREQTHFPPFSFQAVLRAESTRLSQSIDFLARARTLAGDIKGVDLFEPVEAVMARKAGMERAVLLAQSSSRSALQRMLAGWAPQLYALKPGPVRWHLDVDPQEI
jgi:primosomal protein N' (replication factor Y)